MKNKVLLLLAALAVISEANLSAETPESVLADCKAKALRKKKHSTLKELQKVYPQATQEDFADLKQAHTAEQCQAAHDEQATSTQSGTNHAP